LNLASLRHFVALHRNPIGVGIGVEPDKDVEQTVKENLRDYLTDCLRKPPILAFPHGVGKGI